MWKEYKNNPSGQSKYMGKGWATSKWHTTRELQKGWPFQALWNLFYPNMQICMVRHAPCLCRRSCAPCRWTRRMRRWARGAARRPAPRTRPPRSQWRARSRPCFSCCPPRSSSCPSASTTCCTTSAGSGLPAASIWLLRSGPCMGNLQNTQNQKFVPCFYMLLQRLFMSVETSRMVQSWRKRRVWCCGA